MRTIFETNEKGLTLLKRGKVRDVYSAGDGKHLLIITTDRISAFDCVLPTPIPEKGKILTQISNFWFNKTKHIIDNHLVEPDPFKGDWEYEDFQGRSIFALKAKPLPVEAIVRGYLSGSAWKEYKNSGKVCGIILPKGLCESAKLPEPIYTPSTKSESGHDENITFAQTIEILGKELAWAVYETSIKLYTFAAEIALKSGIIIADTKFEFGLLDNKLILIDELLTPDSSRFWSLDSYEEGKSQSSFDKQYVRDYLESIGWDKKPPAPQLPEEVVRKTREKYLEIQKILIN